VDSEGRFWQLLKEKKIARPLKPQSALLISCAFIGKMQT